MKSKLENRFICSLNEWILCSLIMLLQLYSFIVSNDKDSTIDGMIMKDDVVMASFKTFVHLDRLKKFNKEPSENSQ
jgi:hypothetical protein